MRDDLWWDAVLTLDVLDRWDASGDVVSEVTAAPQQLTLRGLVLRRGSCTTPMEVGQTRIFLIDTRVIDELAFVVEVWLDEPVTPPPAPPPAVHKSGGCAGCTAAGGDAGLGLTLIAFWLLARCAGFRSAVWLTRR